MANMLMGTGANAQAANVGTGANAHAANVLMANVLKVHRASGTATVARTVFDRQSFQ